jgi:hypothetical protein
MSLLRIDRSAWLAGFGRKPFVFEHELGDEDLLSADSVAALADALPAPSIEHHVGDVDAVTLDGAAPVVEHAPGYVARHIEELRCWMMLRNVERAPRYDALLQRYFAELEAMLDSSEGAMLRREGYVFFSASGSVTPTHLDSEHNFLCHLRGPKEVVIGGYPDALTAQLKAERKYRGGQRNLDALPHDPLTFELRPGQGVYIPPLMPHWVRTGDDLCVSIAVTFRTALGLRHEKVHAFNGYVRRLGLTPSPPGRSRVRDRTKAGVIDMWRRRPGRRLAAGGH